MAKYRFDEIAINSTEKKKPIEEDKYNYIGLEHLDPQCLQVTRFGSEVAPIGEKLVMKEGDVLFGKRRAYQRKVAIAPFDGIFSAHGMVLRPRTEIISKELFPFFISSNQFLDAAIQISVGSLSPTINWRDLAELEFSIPLVEEQPKLAELLWAFENTREAYKRLLSKTDEFVKAQFIEMFGDPLTNSKALPTKRFIDIVEMQRGFDLPIKQRNREGKVPVYGSNGILDYHDTAPITVPGVITGRSGTIGEVFCATTPYWPLNTTLFSSNTHGNNVIYLMYLLKFFDLSRYANGTGVPTLNRNLFHEEPVIDVPQQLQNKFAIFIESFYKTKFAIQQSLDNLEQCRNALMEKAFG